MGRDFYIEATFTLPGYTGSYPASNHSSEPEIILQVPLATGPYTPTYLQLQCVPFAYGPNPTPTVGDWTGIHTVPLMQYGSTSFTDNADNAVDDPGGVFNLPYSTSLVVTLRMTRVNNRIYLYSNGNQATPITPYRITNPMLRPDADPYAFLYIDAAPSGIPGYQITNNSGNFQIDAGTLSFASDGESAFWQDFVKSEELY